MEKGENTTLNSKVIKFIAQLILSRVFLLKNPLLSVSTPFALQ